MQQIRSWLYVGAYRDTLDTALLNVCGVGAMLLLAAPVEHPGIATMYLPVEDGEILEEDVLRRGVDFILAQRAAGRVVLVACGAGISRSTTFAIAAVKESEHLDLIAAARIVRRAHPDGLPHLALWSSLCRQYQQSLSYLDLLRAHEPGE